jgi:hypothetical protein
VVGPPPPRPSVISGTGRLAPGGWESGRRLGRDTRTVRVGTADRPRCLSHHHAKLPRSTHPEQLTRSSLNLLDRLRSPASSPRPTSARRERSGLPAEPFVQVDQVRPEA